MTESDRDKTERLQRESLRATLGQPTRLEPVSFQLLDKIERLERELAELREENGLLLLAVGAAECLAGGVEGVDYHDYKQAVDAWQKFLERKQSDGYVSDFHKVLRARERKP